MAKVTSTIALHVRVQDYLRTQGFEIDQNYYGSAEEDAEGYQNVFSIPLFRKLPVSHRFLWWVYNTHPLHEIAALYLKNPNIGAAKDNWVLCVYGRNLHEEFLQLANGLCSSFNTNVHVRLEREEPIRVRYDSYD